MNEEISVRKLAEAIVKHTSPNISEAANSLVLKSWEKIINDTFESWYKNIRDTSPPLGVKPYWLHQEHRLRELKDAISRYEEALLIVPSEWIGEKQSIEAYLKGRKAGD